MRATFFTKMVIFNFVLATIPVLFIGIFSYEKTSSEIQNQVNHSKMQLLKQMNTNIEQVLKTVNHTLDQLVTSTVTRKAMRSPLTENDFILYNDLRNELSHMQSFDTKVNDVLLINFKQNWLVKNSGLYRFDQYSEKDALRRQVSLANDKSWILAPSKWFFGEVNANMPKCDYTISLVKKLPANDPQKFGLAFANIPTCDLINFIDFTPTAKEKFMISDNNGNILLYPDESLIGKSVINTGFVKTVKDFSHPSGSFNVKMDKESYTVNYLHSDYNGWIYISIISLDSLTQESKKIGTYTLYISLIIFLISILLSWMGSRRMYTPIRKLVNTVSDTLPEMKKERKNEFQLIGEQVQRLFVSKSRLEKELHDHLQQVRSYFLIKWYQGNVRSKELIDKMKQFEFAHALDEWKIMTAITLQIDSLENTRYEKQDIELLLFAINNIVEEVIPQKERLNPVIIDHTQVTIIGSPAPSAERLNQDVYALTESIQKTIRNYLGLSVSIGISLPFDQLLNAPLAYREGLDALRQRIKLGEGVIIQYEHVNSGRHYLNLNYPNQKEASLIDSIKLAEPEKAKETLHRFMDSIFSLELSPQEYQIPLARLLNNLLNMMQESGIALGQISSDNHSLYERLLALQTASEIEEWFLSQIILPIIAIFRDRQDSQYHTISEKIVDMIQHNYDTDLTIEKCANELHYNANYLSSVFRKETGLSFSEYLTSHRFSMAKKWLSSSELTVKEIAEKLCYNNSQNFIRSFRKVESMTPGQYRDKFGKRSG